MPDDRPTVAAIVPRLMSRAEAAAYCGVKPDTFDEYRRAGLVPEPLPGTKRWDRKAIDRRFDSLSGLDDDDADAGDDPHAEWEAAARLCGST